MKPIIHFGKVRKISLASMPVQSVCPYFAINNQLFEAMEKAAFICIIKLSVQRPEDNVEEEMLGNKLPPLIDF